MAKWAGVIGFVDDTTETAPSVYREKIVERQYYGDVLKNNRLVAADKVNDDISVQNQLSIVADAYAMNHFYSIKYATFCGVRWIVSNVEVEYPRLTLTLGGVWNGSSGND